MGDWLQDKCNEIQKAQQEHIQKSFGSEDIEKARSGVYKPTKQNLKEGKAGQKYGESKKEKKFPELKEGLSFSIGEQSGGGEVTAKITKVDGGKYTIETFTKYEHKSSHTFGEKEIKELIEEGGFKIKK